MVKRNFVSVILAIVSASFLVQRSQASDLSCADPDAQRLVTVGTYGFAYKQPFFQSYIAPDELFGFLHAIGSPMVSTPGITTPVPGLSFPLEQGSISDARIDDMIDKFCLEKTESKLEEAFCKYVGAAKLSFIRTIDINPRTKNLDCAASIINPEGKRVGEIKYKVESTSDEGFFVTLE